MRNLSSEVQIRKIASGAAAGTTDIESSVVDFTGYDGVLIFTTIATAADNNTLKIQQGGKDLVGAVVSADENGQVVFVDVSRPLGGQGGELKAVITRGTSTATGDIYAILYNGRTRPEVNFVDAVDGIKGVLAISPATV
ncbi:hypothetical protein PTHTG4_27380 [Parageobacillus thermoglucosidasius]|uniref:hypothetical protein n=1 Tax=Parageobacillus thermoglucosidasius TaxID=1426 RepID=UPI000F617B2E|nr:hypothetical protein [Parageobacillus thermoglucosidasius]GCD83674.1 hypothetical protein PTHTG4_27380 [Parageobacillus thermoglucosidasius]